MALLFLFLFLFFFLSCFDTEHVLTSFGVKCSVLVEVMNKCAAAAAAPAAEGVVSSCSRPGRHIVHVQVELSSVGGLLWIVFENSNYLLVIEDTNDTFLRSRSVM